MVHFNCSNGRAARLVASAASPPKFVVVGGRGRVGRSLVNLNPNDSIAVGRGELKRVLLSSGGGDAAASRIPLHDQLILVATTNDALEQVIADCPPDRRDDLVFLQNGMLLPLLEAHGLATNTQALLYFSAAPDGSVTDGLRTVVCGRHAAAFAALLHSGGLRCRVVDSAGEYLALAIEKLLWASIYWLLSAALGGLPVGQVAVQHAADVEEVAAELLPLAQAYVAQAAGRLQLGSTSQVEALTVPGVCASMAAYSLSIPAAVPSMDMALAEFAWRNGWFLSQRATPAHTAWLERAGVPAELLVVERSFA